MRRACPWLVLCAVLAVARAAAAQPQATPTARLSYTRGPGTEHCPDEDSVRNAVSSRLGYDPFQPEAPTTVSVEVSRAAGNVRVRVERRDEAGRITGSREMASAKNDCTELASAMTLAISIAIDPQSLARPSPEQPPPAPPAPAVTPPPPPCPPPPPPPSEPVIFRAGLGALVSFGSAPAPAIGLWAHVGGRWQNGSIGIEGRADFSASGPIEPEGTVAASLLQVALLPCMHGSVFVACALVSAGALRGSGEDITREATDTTFFASAGARAGVEIPITDRVEAWVHADLAAVLTRTHLRMGGRRVWTTEPVMAAVAAGPALRF